MDRYKLGNRIVKSTTLTALAGISVIILIYLVLFTVKDIPFTFQALYNMHRNYRILFLTDIFPVLAALAAYIVVRRWWDETYSLQETINKEKRNEAFIQHFISKLIQGDLDQEDQDAIPDTELSQSLIKLRQALLRNRDEVARRKLEDDQRNWISEGLAQTGDLLRSYTDDIENLGYTIISFLVRYLKANQGGFFIIEDEMEQKRIRMIACHAYERRKFPDSVTNWGEGLIGAVALEKKSYYTSKIPDGYLTITSGLGKANPRYLLITPLLLNNTVYGIFEIASFQPLEPYQISFIERAAESTAVTLNAIGSSLRTSLLLKETQAQAAKLAQQEEQVRKNIEELRATQEEAARQAEKFISFTNSVNHTLIRAEYGTDGTLLYANTKFLKKLGYSGNREVEGKPISMFINEKDMEWFNGMWEKLAGGGQHFEGYMKHITRQGQDLWTMATYTCVRRDDGSVEKILFLAIDTTEYKKQSIDFEGQLEAINRLSQKAEFTPDGRYLLCNRLFREALKYTDQEMERMNVFDFITRNDQERFNEIWENVTRGVPYQGQIRLRNKYEEENWFRASFSSINDMYGEVEKVIFIANEITKEKDMEGELIRQNEQLMKKEEEFRLQNLDLRKKLEDSEIKWTQERGRFKSAGENYLSVIKSFPLPLIQFNNLGFVILVNKIAEKQFGIKNDRLSDIRLHELFTRENSEEFIHSLIDPAKQKKEGVHRGIKFQISGKEAQKSDLTLLKTEAGDELIYTLIIG